MQEALRAALSHHRQTRRACARSLRRALHAHRAAIIASVRHVLAPRPPTGPDGLETRVLRVIERHPDGVTALDVGNELGVDWHRVVESMRALVEAGFVEQVDLEFYASRNARGRW